MTTENKKTINAIVALAKSLTKEEDEAERKKLLDTLRDVAYSLESPEDTMQRIMFYNLQLASIRVGIDLKIFEILSKSDIPMTVEQLAAKTACAPVLLSEYITKESLASLSESLRSVGRILRYLASIATIKETGKDTFAGTNVTSTLAVPAFQGGIHHYFDSIGPAFQVLPDFLKETQYADIKDMTNTPLQKAWNTDMPAFIWVQTKPENFAHFNNWMAVQRHGMPTWLDVYPFQDKVRAFDLTAETPLFVDLGGGLGHQCIALRERFPELSGRVILQEIPATLPHAIAHEKVEHMAQDFFLPQLIKGAKFYYLRNILHDYHDEKCVLILKNIIAAMEKDSVILIDEMVLPNAEVHWQAAQLDMMMMTALASMERTKEQWYALMESAGLKINQIWTYTTSLQDSIIEAVPA